MRDTLEVAIPRTVEFSPRVEDRVLRAILNLARVQDGKFIDQVIQCRPQVVDRLSDEDANCGGPLTASSLPADIGDL